MADIRIVLLSLILLQADPFWCVNLKVAGPQDFDGIYDNASVIVAGSVIQLFCSASGQFTAPHIQWTWNNITFPENAQLPHLMVKSWTEKNTITSSVLTIYGFSTSDNGSYQCNASDNGSSGVSQPLLLTAINGSNALTIIRELNNKTGTDRTSVPLGSSSISSNGSFLRCSAEQPPSSSLAAPSIIWLKDGTQLSGDGVRVVITTTYSTGTSNRTTSYVRIFNFSQSDAGVYQCVFYDTPSQGGEVITTRPYKVDTGPIKLTAVSQSSISLCPPGPLVIQVEAGGEYAGIQWTRTPIALNVSSDKFVDFQQTFVMTVTSEEDWGLYEVNFTCSNGTLNCNSSNTTFKFNVSTYSNVSCVFPASSITPTTAAVPVTLVTTPTVTSTDAGSSTIIIIIAVPICGGACLILMLFLLVAVMGVARCHRKEKDELRVINPAFDKKSTLDGKSGRSTLSGHLGKYDSKPATLPAIAVQDPCPPPPLPFGSYSQHIYDLMPSLSKPAPIFEDLNNVLAPDGIPPHAMGTENTVYDTSNAVAKVSLPGYAVLDESIVSSRSPSPEQCVSEYSYAAVRRTLTRSCQSTVGPEKDDPQTRPANPLDSSQLYHVAK